jgi:hypothetical protein
MWAPKISVHNPRIMLVLSKDSRCSAYEYDSKYDIWCRMVFYVTMVTFWMTLLTKT